MEHHFSSFPFLILSVTFILFMSMILKAPKTFKTTRTRSKLPPGPWKLPLFGSIHCLVGSSSPYQRMRELAQKYGPLIYLKLGETPTVVVSSAEVAKEVLKTHDIIFAQRPRLLGADIIFYGPRNISLSPTGDYWKQLRKICTLEMLSAKRVRSFQSIREEEVSHLINYISTKAGSPINLSEKFFSMSCMITARATFGDKCCKEPAALIYIAQEISKVNENVNISYLFPSQKWLHVITGKRRELEEIHLETDMVLESIIHEAVTNNKSGEREGEADNLLSFLLNIKDHGGLEFPLTIDNIKAVVLDLVLAGTEALSTIVEWAIAEMLKNPRVMKRAQAEVRQIFGSKGYIDETAHAELKFLKAILKETLRLHPPAPLLIPRECRETCEINGYTIPVATQLLVNVWAIGRDPKYWSEAEKFWPERFLDCPIDYNGSNFEFIPFGAGKRMCPGMLFAAVNIELALAQLLYNFDWEFPIGTTPESLDMTETLGTTVRKKNNLLLIPISYNKVVVV